MWALFVMHKPEIPVAPAEIREQHVKYLEKLRDEGKILANGRFLDGSGGLVLVPDCTEDEIRQLIEADPYYKEKVSDYTVKEWAGKIGQAF